MSDKNTRIYSQINVSLRRPSDVDVVFRMLQGVEHIVVPATMLVPGVHVGHGDINAILYPKEALATNLSEWMGRPVTKGHSIDEFGRIVAPVTPEAFEQFQIGLLFNSEIKGNNQELTIEVWLNKERLESLAPKILEKILDGEEVEVSVDMLTDAIRRSGTFEGQHYDAVAVRLHGQGLAILEDEEGACSFVKGCGIRNRACKKDNGCTECKNITAEESNMTEEDKNKKGGEGGNVSQSEDVGIIKGFMVALTSILGQKGNAGAADGCGCNGGGNGGNGGNGEKNKKKAAPAAPATMEAFLASAPEELRTTMTMALASAKAVEDAKTEKLKGLRTEILALDKTFTEEVTGKMDEPTLTTLKTALSKKPATDFSLASGVYGENVIIDDEVLAIPSWPKTEQAN